MNYSNDNPEIIEFGHSPEAGARLYKVRGVLYRLGEAPNVVKGAQLEAKESRQQQGEAPQKGPVVNIDNYRNAQDAKEAVNSARGAVAESFVNNEQEYPDVLKKAA